MSYIIKQQITRVNKGRVGSNKPQWLVIHFVGASGQAKANANYFEKVNRGASAHYFIDPNDIYQVVPDNTPAWHIGDGSRTVRGKYNGYHGFGATNNNSIGLELCQDTSTGSNVWDWDFHPVTVEKALWLTKKLQKKYNIPNSRVIRHYDASGKSCPGNWRKNNWSKWWDFKKRLVGETVEESKPKPSVKPSGSIEQKAKDTIAGKYGNGEERKQNLGKEYSQVMKRVNEILSGKTTTPKKSNSTIAKEVIAGKWGNGQERTNRLQKAGYNPTAIQNEVNKQVGVKSKKSNSTIAKEVIAGKWGNGQDRMNRLRRAGYNPTTIQNEVNKQVGVKSNKKVINKKLIDEVIAGKWGNGQDRANRLRRAGYNPTAVQREVNKRF